MTNYGVVYLAGGAGERLHPLTYETQKCLLEIDGKSIAEHWLEALLHSKAEVDVVNIITGYCEYKFRKLLGRNYHGLKIRYINNPLYKITGAAQGLYLAYRYMNVPTIILEGDHYMDPRLMEMLIESEYDNCILVDPDLSKINYDEETLAYGYKGTVESLKWMPPYPNDTLGEALTIFKLSRKASRDLRLILENYLLEDGSAKRQIIEPFNRLMAKGDIHYIETEGLEWTEIDFESDLEKARRMKF